MAAHSNPNRNSVSCIRINPQVNPQTEGDLEAGTYPKTGSPGVKTPRGVTMLPNKVVMKRRGKKHSAHYADIKDGLFVKPILIGRRSTATPDYEVDILIAARIAGKSDEEIRALVQKLHAARKEVL